MAAATAAHANGAVAASTVHAAYGHGAAAAAAAADDAWRPCRSPALSAAAAARNGSSTTAAARLGIWHARCEQV